MNILLEQLYKGEHILISDVKKILNKLKEVLIQQTNIVNVSLPIIICGDIHGQFHDLIQIFEIGGKIPNTNYLFLGNYVNRGYGSVQVILLLYALKIKFPKRIQLLRGNHQSWILTQAYDFYDECNKKYPQQNIWKYFCDSFNYLPLASIVNQQYFCVHAGLSPSLNSIHDLKKVERFVQIPQEGIMNDILYSTPDSQQQGWNLAYRGPGFLFGPDITQQFLFQQNLSKIIRSHQFLQNGYQQMHNNNLISIFSAPNYRFRCKNQAAIVQIDENSNRTCIKYQMNKKQKYQTVFKSQSQQQLKNDYF